MPVIAAICSLIFLTGLFYFTHLYFFGFLLILPLAVFIVGTANYYNFMDGINGIAAITGIVAFCLLGFYGSLNGRDPAMIALCFALAFACAGFLPFNMPAARVFMGDVGSVLLGFVFACIVVLFSNSFSEFVVLASFLFPFQQIIFI